VARNQSTGALHYGRIINGLLFRSWHPLPSGIEPWGTGPAVIWDGDHLRFFAADASFPNTISPITFDNTAATTARDAGKAIYSQGQATMQPVVALMNGDVDLVSYWYTLGMFDQLVK